jgi:hypothetical protein
MSTVDQPAPVSPDDDLTADERANMTRVLSSPEEFPELFGSWIAEYVALNGKVQPHQIQGLSRLIPHAASVTADEGRFWEDAYGDVATVGPTLEGLGRGTYLVITSAEVLHQEASVNSRMSVSINGAAPSDDNAVSFFTTSGVNRYPIRRYLLLTLPLPSNTLRLQYKRIGKGSSGANFRNRYIVAIRVGN